MADGRSVRLPWEVQLVDDRLIARQVSPIRTLVYTFRLGAEGQTELIEAHVEQYGREALVTRVVFSPALPDLGRRFTGRSRSRFVVDINGQDGHAVGVVEAWWDEAGPTVAVRPEAPWWTADRPLLARLVHDDGAVSLDVAINRGDDP